MHIPIKYVFYTFAILFIFLPVAFVFFMRSGCPGAGCDGLVFSPLPLFFIASTASGFFFLIFGILVSVQVPGRSEKTGLIVASVLYLILLIGLLWVFSVLMDDSDMVIFLFPPFLIFGYTGYRLVRKFIAIF